MTAPPGQFFLFLDGTPKVGNYWVVALGPKDPITGLYSWSVVSTPFETQLFILARDVAAFKATDEASVLELVKDKGFVLPFNKPLETYQGPDCVYHV